jgi:hypothetical protein
LHDADMRLAADTHPANVAADVDPTRASRASCTATHAGGATDVRMAGRATRRMEDGDARAARAAASALGRRRRGRAQ